MAAAFSFIVITLHWGVAEANPLSQDPKEVSWHISALKVTFDNKRNLYIAEKDVVITGGETRLEADYVEFSNKTKDAFAQGNVLLISGDDSIACSAMNINLSTEIGTINKGTIFIQENNFYIHGETIRKTGKFSYHTDKGSITSCAGESPDWKISGKNIKVTIEGYGTANHAVLWARKVPALYSPFLVFPVHTKRQSGLLIPRITSSDRKGFEYEQPLYLAVSDSTDATIYTDYMSDRGLKLGTEFRYVLDNKSKGALFIDLLDDQKIDDGTDNTKNYSFSTTPQRTNTDRYWFRMKHNQDLPNGFTSKLDIDIASDEDYLQEFKDGFSGYDETKKYFEKEFGRSLDEYDDTTRKNWLNFNKSWSTYTFNAEAIWYDNISARRQDTDDTTLQTLPSLEFNASKQQIGPSRFFYSLDSEYRSFYRQDTTAELVNGQRADIYPKVFLPVKLGSFFNFEPWAGLRETIYYTNNFTDSDGNSDNFRTRQMYNIGADLSTTLIKIFNSDNWFAEKVKHELTPKLEYIFTPNVIQDDLPSFDAIDRLAEQNILTWSLTNYFTARDTVTAPKGEEKLTYREFAYFKLYQSYDIRKKNDSESRPFSDITFDSELRPHRFFSLDLDLSWSPYDNQFKTFNVGNILKDNRGDALETEYRFTKDESESLYSKIDASLTDELSAFYSIEQNLRDNKTVETRTGFTVAKSCWEFNLEFSESPGNRSITFLINLHGIGEFGI